MQWIDWTNPVADVPLNRGLVSWWLAGEGPYWGGPKFRDVVAISNGRGGNHGTLINNPSWTSSLGRPGGWASLNFSSGASQYLDIGNPAALTGLSELSIFAWVRPLFAGESAFPHIVGKGSNASREFIFYRYGGFATLAIEIYSSGGTSTTTANVIVDLAWQHVGFTWKAGDTVKLFHNGIEVASAAAQTGSITNHSLGAAIGRSGATDIYHWNGHLDDVRAFNRQLSPPQARSLYDASRQSYPNELNRMPRVTWEEPAAAGVDISAFATQPQPFNRTFEPVPYF